MLLAKKAGVVEGHRHSLKPRLPGQISRKPLLLRVSEKLHTLVLVQFAGAPGAPAIFSAERRKPPFVVIPVDQWFPAGVGNLPPHLQPHSRALLACPETFFVVPAERGCVLLASSG